MKKRKVGILGSGIVGQTLADGFFQHGCEVMIGTRNPDKLKNWQFKTGGKGEVGNFEEAAKFGELIVLATKGTVSKFVLELAGIENLDGKTIIDTTNPISDEAPENGVLKFFTTHDESLMEQLQESAPKANFVKAFSSIGNALMVNPFFGKERPTMFICGNNDDAKKEVSDIVEFLGFDPEDMGKVTSARAIEPLCMLWCIPGFQKNEWSHAFRLIRKK